jgi:hypothetical protein
VGKGYHYVTAAWRKGQYLLQPMLPEVTIISPQRGNFDFGSYCQGQEGWQETNAL